MSVYRSIANPQTSRVPEDAVRCFFEMNGKGEEVAFGLIEGSRGDILGCAITGKRMEMFLAYCFSEGPEEFDDSAVE